MGELNRTAETNNLASQPELDSQRASRAGLEKLSTDAMPQAANKIGSAQTQAQQNPQAARGQLPRDLAADAIGADRDVAALAATIGRVLADAQLRGDQGRRGRARVLEQHDAGRNARQIAALMGAL